MINKEMPMWTRLNVSLLDWLAFRAHCLNQGLNPGEVLANFIKAQANSYRVWAKQYQKKGR